MGKTPFVDCLESLLWIVHRYFVKSSKKALKFSKLAKIIKTKDLKILKHCKTRSIGLLSPCKRILIEYGLLVVKMVFDYISHPASYEFYHLFSNVETSLSMATIILLFQAIQSFIKFAQEQVVLFLQLCCCSEEVSACVDDVVHWLSNTILKS